MSTLRIEHLRQSRGNRSDLLWTKMMRIIGSGESVRTWCPFHKWQYSTVRTLLLSLLPWSELHRLVNYSMQLKTNWCLFSLFHSSEKMFPAVTQWMEIDIRSKLEYPFRKKIYRGSSPRVNASAGNVTTHAL